VRAALAGARDRVRVADVARPLEDWGGDLVARLVPRPLPAASLGAAAPARA
jgi:hypothetical protein